MRRFRQAILLFLVGLALAGATSCAYYYDDPYYYPGPYRSYYYDYGYWPRGSVYYYGYPSRYYYDRPYGYYHGRGWYGGRHYRHHH